MDGLYGNMDGLYGNMEQYSNMDGFARPGFSCAVTTHSLSSNRVNVSVVVPLQRNRRAPRRSRERDLKRAFHHVYPRLPLGTVSLQVMQDFRRASQEPCAKVLSSAERAAEWRLRLAARRKALLRTITGPEARLPSTARHNPLKASHQPDPEKDVSLMQKLGSSAAERVPERSVD